MRMKFGPAESARAVHGRIQNSPRLGTSRKSQQQSGRYSGVGPRHTRSGIGRSALETRVQASTDALRRKQKAKAAAKVKKYKRFKQKMKLLQEMEAAKGAAQSPIIATEFAGSTALSDDYSAPNEVGRESFGKGPSYIVNQRGREADDGAACNANCDGEDRTIVTDSLHESRFCPNVAGSHEIGCTSATGIQNRDSEKHSQSPQHQQMETKRRRWCNNSGRDLHVPENEIDSKSLVAPIRQRRFQPFQKELAIAAARRQELEDDKAKLQREREAAEKRRKESSEARRKKSKLIRKRTSSGQPVMKHRMDAILERIERSVSETHQNTEN